MHSIGVISLSLSLSLSLSIYIYIYMYIIVVSYIQNMDTLRGAAVRASLAAPPVVGFEGRPAMPPGHPQYYYYY